MRFLFESKDQISLNHVRYLFSLSFKHDFISVLQTLLDLHSESLDVIHDLTTLTMRAVSSINVSSASTSVAVCLHLHLHAKANLDLLHNDTLAIAFRAGLDLAVFCACASALRAIYIASN